MADEKPKTVKAASPRKSGEAASSRISRRPLVSALTGVVTPTGRGLLITIVLSLILAVTVQWVEALALALAGTIALVLAALRVASRPAHVVSIRVPNDRIVAGQTAVGEIRVGNETTRRARSGIIELPIGSGTGEFVIPALGAGESWDDMFLISSRRRGIINVGPARSVRSDPLGLLRRVRSWEDPVVLHVHPRTVRVPFDATGFQLDVEGVATGKLSSSDVSFHALRDYEPGDDRRSVHWPSTARLGRLIVRQYEETHRSHHVIVFDTSRSQWNRDSFETAVSVVASLGLASLSESRPVSVTTMRGWLPSGVPVRLLDAMAEVDVTDGGDLPLRVREAVAQRPGISALSIIVGASCTEEDAAHLTRLAPIDVPVSVIRVGTQGGVGRRSLSRGTLVECEHLEDLPRVITAGGLS